MLSGGPEKGPTHLHAYMAKVESLRIHPERPQSQISMYVYEIPEKNTVCVGSDQKSPAHSTLVRMLPITSNCKYLAN